MRFLLSVLLLLSFAGSASAQGEDRRAEAKEFFRAGEQSYNASQYGVAAEAFERAYSLLPLPAIAFSTAQAYRLQFFVDKQPAGLKRAIELYREYIDKVPQGGRRQDAVTSLAELEPILLRMEASNAETGQGPIESQRSEARTHIMVTSSVRGAVVQLDEEEESPVPMDRDVEAGEYRVRVSAEGYFPYDEKRKVAEGQFHLVPVQLVEKPALVRIRGASGASVSVDGRPVGLLPLQRDLELSPGKHILAVRERGHRAWSKELDLGRGEEIELKASLETTGQRKISYWIGGASAASLVVGSLYVLAATGSNRDARLLNEKRLDEGLSNDEFKSYKNAIQDRDDERRLGLGFLAAGGIFAVAGGLLYLVDMPGVEAARLTSPKRKQGPAEDEGFEPMVLVPSIGPGQGGLALQGRF